MTNSPTITSPLSSRTRTNSNGSDTSHSSDEMKPVVNYEHMNLEDILADKLDTSSFEKTRSFNPRKQRSCHKRAVPVSAEKRKEESSKNSREYTKRNRDEIKVCQKLRNDLQAKKSRLLQITSELKKEHVEQKIVSSIKEFEKMLENGPFKSVAVVRSALRIPNEEPFLQEYRLAASDADTFVLKTEVDPHEIRLEQLRQELGELENKKDNLASQKEKTNYASSKSRLKQRVIRAELKVDCYHIWRQIENLKVRGAKLNDCCNALKKTIWEKIISIYYDFSRTLTTIDNDMEKLHQINKIIMYYLPYSKVEELPKTPEKEAKPELPSDWTLNTPASESSTVQDSVISTTTSFIPFSSPIMIQPAHVPPSYTLTLPTVPMPPVSPKKDVVKQILLPVVTVTDEGTTTQLLPEQEENIDVLTTLEGWKLNETENGKEEEEDVEVDIMTADDNDAPNTTESYSRKRSASPSADEPDRKKSPTPTASSSPPSLSSLQSPTANQIPPLVHISPMLAQQSLMDFNTAMFATLYNQIMNSPSSVSTSGHNAFNSQVQIANWLQYLGTPKNI